MSRELKVKSKHLSVEAQIIRHEERKLKRQIVWQKDRQIDCSELQGEWFSMNNHRRVDVRNENRATFLARAFIANKPYKSVEKKINRNGKDLFRWHILPRIVSMVSKYDRRFSNVSTNDVKDVVGKAVQQWIEQ